MPTAIKQYVDRGIQHNYISEGCFHVDREITGELPIGLSLASEVNLQIMLSSTVDHILNYNGNQIN